MNKYRYRGSVEVINGKIFSVDASIWKIIKVFLFEKIKKFFRRFF